MNLNSEKSFVKRRVLLTCSCGECKISNVKPMDISHLIGVLFLLKLCFLIFADLSKDVFFVYGKDYSKI